MSGNETTLLPNELAFIALINEYCQALERIDLRNEMVEAMLKLLPRIYISAADLNAGALIETYINPSLDESTYNRVREKVAAVMADEDIYLEVFLEDMKYSDTPISASISENLADLYQEFFNVIEAVQYVSTSEQADLLRLCYENFTAYWGQTLVNVLRALHNVKFQTNDETSY